MMPPPWTRAEWYLIEQAAREVRRSYAAYRDPNGPWYQAPSRKRAARENERFLRYAANVAIAARKRATP